MAWLNDSNWLHWNWIFYTNFDECICMFLMNFKWYKFNVHHLVASVATTHTFLLSTNQLSLKCFISHLHLFTGTTYTTSCSICSLLLKQYFLVLIPYSLHNDMMKRYFKSTNHVKHSWLTMFCRDGNEKDRDTQIDSTLSIWKMNNVEVCIAWTTSHYRHNSLYIILTNPRQSVEQSAESFGCIYLLALYSLNNHLMMLNAEIFNIPANRNLTKSSTVCRSSCLSRSIIETMECCCSWCCSTVAIFVWT